MVFNSIFAKFDKSIHCVRRLWAYHLLLQSHLIRSMKQGTTKKREQYMQLLHELLQLSRTGATGCPTSFKAPLEWMWSCGIQIWIRRLSTQENKKIVDRNKSNKRSQAQVEPQHQRQLCMGHTPKTSDFEWLRSRRSSVGASHAWSRSFYQVLYHTSTTSMSMNREEGVGSAE